MIHSSSRVASETVAAHYDELDLFYREVWGEHVHHGLWISGRETPEEAVIQLSRRVAERAGLHHGTPVCDVGCGYGATARLLEREYRAVVTGITLSRKQFADAVARSGERITFLHGDWLRNGLPDGAFGAVIAIETSEHIEEKSRFFAEAARVLRPGGKLVVCGWLAANRLSDFQRHQIERICLAGRMPGIGTEQNYCAWIEDAGFALDRLEDLSRQVERTWVCLARRFVSKAFRDPRYLRFLVRRGTPNRIFPLTLLRIVTALKTGALRYGMITATLE